MQSHDKGIYYIAAARMDNVATDVCLAVTLGEEGGRWEEKVYTT